MSKKNMVKLLCINAKIVYQCKNCVTQLTSKAAFKKHNYEVHDQVTKSYKKKALKKKNAVLVKECPIYICPVIDCGKEFVSAYLITNHLLIHNIDNIHTALTKRSGVL